MKKGAPISNRKADCHPDRKHFTRGMCQPCYVKYKNSANFVRVGRQQTKITCGHEDGKHVGKGFCSSCYAKHLRATDPKYSKEARRNGETKRRYGITLSQRDEMIEMQGGACAICRKPFADNGVPHIDHCHSTGAVRGILCFTCNKGLGMFGDNQDGVQRALNYLIQAEQRSARKI